jgi:tRNA-specific 2-thiouridylase
VAAGRVLVAMSGGVDSSVAAAILKQQGYDVSGVTLQLQPQDDKTSHHAAQVARHLGIPYLTLDFIAAFSDRVITPFCSAYLAGHTPYPCVRCNLFIKFGALLEYALTRALTIWLPATTP